MTLPSFYIGCDISKAHLDIFCSDTQRHLRLANTKAAISTWLADLSPDKHLVIYEATGAYSRHLQAALTTHQVPARQVNPVQVRRFAAAVGQRAKTDRMDAELLARFGDQLGLLARAPLCPQRQRLKALQTRRDQLVDLRKRERTRHHELDDPALMASADRVIACLSEEIARLDTSIREQIASDAQIADAATRLQTAPGIGPVSATVLLAHMPELGQLSPKAIAALTGLAPFNHDSGQLRGKRCISGGRRRVRHTLYMAALAAVRTSKRYRETYTRICKRNPAKKVALIAVARKLLTALNAMERDKKAFA